MRKTGILCALLLVIFFLPGMIAGAAEKQESDLQEAGGEKSGVLHEFAFQTPAFIHAAQTFVPLRELGDLMNYAVDWDPATKQIRVTGETAQFTILLQENNKLIMRVLSEERPGDAADGRHAAAAPENPRLWEYWVRDGHIYVPLRPLSELFPWRLHWDAEAWTVSIWTDDTTGPAEPADPDDRREQPALSFVVARWTPAGTTGPGPGESPGKVAYLTFDDGPSARVTPGILDVLAAENVPATFFVVGEHVQQYPDLIRCMHEAGHTIGNHTYSHRAAVIYASPEALMREVHRTENLIYEITGERTRIFRAPYGSYPNLTAPFRQALSDSGYKYVDWNVDSLDSRADGVPVRTIVDAVKRQVAGKERVIILFHDLPAKKTTVQALPEIISYLKAQQYSIRPLTYETEMITHW